MTRYLIAAAAVVMLALIVSCGGDSTGPSSPGDYLPLTVGNQWVYSTSGYMVGAGGDTVTVGGTKNTTITGETTGQGGQSLYVVFDSVYTEFTTPDTMFTNTVLDTVYICKTDTEYRLYEDTVTTDYEILMKLPVVVDDSWVPKPDEPTVTRTVRSTSESVTVSAGTFSECTDLRDTDSESPDFLFDMFLSRGNGIVKFTTYMVEANLTINVDYDLSSSVIK